MDLSKCEKRLASLEQGMEELVPFSFQWLNEDGMPAGPLIERMVPKSRIGWLYESN
jgi:hypothetical protein